MRALIGLTLMVAIGFAGWQIGGSLSNDAIAMAVGVLLGVLAGIPVALLLMAGNRRRDTRDEGEPMRRRLPPGDRHGQWAAPPPIIVVTGMAGNGANNSAGSTQYAQPGQWPAPPAAPGDPSARRFKVVGEREEWIDEW